MAFRGGRVARLAGAAICCLLAQGVPLGQVSTVRPLPTLVEAVEPAYPVIAQQARVSGSVELNVVTNGERVAKVDIVKPNPLLDLAAQRDVSTWVFAPHQPTSFRMTVDFEIRQSEFVDQASCVTREMPEVITHDLPTHVRVIAHPDFICDKVEPVKKTISASALAGQVVCDCPARSPVPDATVSYYLNPTPAELRRRSGYSTPFQGHVEVDANGRFQIDGVPPGTYSMEVGSLTYNSRSYHVRVQPDDKKLPPLSLPIVVNPAVSEYLRLHPRETAWVGTKQIPTYPIEALKAGVEGIVVIRAAPGTAPVAVEGHQLLASAAVDFAKTWKTASSNHQPFDVRITYRLVEGDCTGLGPRVVLKLPREVEITAKRMIPCEPIKAR